MRIAARASSGAIRTLSRSIPGMLLAIGLAPPVSAGPLEPAREYGAGSRIESPWAGASFEVPAGFTGAYDPDLRAVLLASSSASALLGVFVFSEGAPEEVGAAAVALIERSGTKLVPESVDAPDERTILARYVALTDDGPGRLVGIVRAGAAGNSVVAAALGAPDATPRLEELVKDLIATVEWSAPTASAWKQRLAGVRLEGGGTDSASSPGGAGGGGSYASGTEEWMEFCPDGTYAYRLYKESYMSIEGVSAERTERDEHRGRWWLVSDVAGRAILALEATDGRAFHWDMEETDAGARVEGVDYRAVPATVCR